MNASRLFAFAIGVAGLAARLEAAPTADHQFAWDRANASIAAAQTRDEFGAAAGYYRELVLDGVRNGPLFFNYGTALLKAGQAENASRAFLRAERYSGSDAEIRHNLLCAEAAAHAGEHPALPWYRLFLFWHYNLDLSTRLALACAAVSLLCLALAFRLWECPRTARALHILGAWMLIVFGSSAGTSLHAESRDQVRERVLVTRPPQPRTATALTTATDAIPKP